MGGSPFLRVVRDVPVLHDRVPGSCTAGCRGIAPASQWHLVAFLPRHRTRFATISISRGRAKNSRCGVGGFGRKSFYHVLPTKQGGSEDRRTLEIVSRNYYCKPRGGFPARTHAISIDFYSLFSLLNPSPVAVAIGQETGLLGMEVRYFTRRGNTTWQTVDVGDAGINLSVCWLPGLEPLFPTCRRLAQKRRIHRTSINGKP